MTRIILDCDPGHDDAIAILLALASPEVRLEGITTVAGNATLEHTTANALKVLELVDRTDVPVAAGAAGPLSRPLVVAANVHGESGMDGPVLPEPVTRPVEGHAVELMAEVLSHGPATLVPTGPLTNVATLLERHPEVVGNVERVVLMGGATGLGNVTPAAEFNIWVDPEAAAVVFGSGLDLTMIGLEVTHKALLEPRHGDELRGNGAVGSFVADLLDFFRDRYERVFGTPIAPIHDAAAVAVLVDPTLVVTAELNVEVELDSELNRGRTVVDVHAVTGRPPNARVGMDVDPDRFARLLLDRLALLDDRPPDRASGAPTDSTRGRSGEGGMARDG